MQTELNYCDEQMTFHQLHPGASSARNCVNAIMKVAESFQPL